MGRDARTQLFRMQQTHHQDAYQRRIEDGSVRLWLDDKGSASAWVHELGMAPVRPYFEQLSSHSVVTIGDGKGGREARFFEQLGHNALATDLCTGVLEEAQRQGLLSQFAEANAEALPFDDASFDFAVTKETLHHLQRPYLALYEMLRVARKGVVLIEPNLPPTPTGSEPPSRTWKQSLRQAWRRLRGRETRPQTCSPLDLPHAEFEPSGNYVYRFGPNELSQVGLALGVHHVAVGYAHHLWRPEWEQLAADQLPRVIEKEERELEAMDERNGLAARPMIVFCFFKSQPTPPEQAALAEGQMEFVQFRDNPQLKRTA